MVYSSYIIQLMRHYKLEFEVGEGEIVSVLLQLIAICTHSDDYGPLNVCVLLSPK